MGTPTDPVKKYTYSDSINLIKKNSQILPYMAIYPSIWVYWKNRTRTETVIYWVFVGKKPYRNVEKNQTWAVFQGFSLDAFCSELRCFWKWVSAKAPTIDIQHLKFHTCETFQIRVWEIVFGKCEYTSTSLLCSMYDVFTWYPSLMRSVFTFPSAILWTNRCGVLGECPSLCSPVFGAALPWVLVKITSWQLRRRWWPTSNKWKWS